MAQSVDGGREQLIASLQERVEELAQLNRTAIALTSELDLRRLLQMITDAARKVTGAQYAAIFLIPEIAVESAVKPFNTVIFDLAASSGEEADIERHFKHLGPLHPVFWGRPLLLVGDLFADPRSSVVPRGQIVMRSFLGMQMRTREDRILGALLIGDTQPGRFRAQHVELIEVLSAQATVALHNAQLIARERKAMKERAASLEQEVREHTVELERRNQELNKVATDLQTLHHELTEAQKRQMLADERSRIAQELHDRVQQTLFTVGLKASWVLSHLPSNSILIHSVRAIKQLASLGTAQVRDAIFALASSELQEGGLVSMLYTLIEDLRESSTIEADLVVVEWSGVLPPHIENTLYMIAQEALSNVRRHAQATTVIVTVQVTSEQAVLVVQDNGVGLSPQALQGYRSRSTHLGLRGMHKRMEELNGQFSLVNGEECGLIVKAVAPLGTASSAS